MKLLGDGAHGHVPASGQGHVAARAERGAPDGQVVARHGRHSARGLDAALGQHVLVGGIARVGAGQGLRDDVAPGLQADVPALDEAAVVGNVVQGREVQAAAAQQAAGVFDIDRGQVHVFAVDAAFVQNAFTGIDVDVFGLHAAAGRDVLLGGRGQVEVGHKHLPAHVLFFFQPDDVLGQGRHLGRGEGHADAEIKPLGLGRRRVHEPAHLVRVRTVAVEEALTRGGQNLLLHKARFIKGVAQQDHLLAVLVQADAAQEILRTVKKAHIREHRVGFNEVMMARRRGRTEHGTARKRIARALRIAVGQRNALAVAVIVEGIRNVHIQPGLGGKHDGGTPDLFVGFIVGPEIFAGEVIIGVPALHGFPDRARPLQHGVLVVDVGRLDGEIISGGNGAVVVFKQIRVDENVSARKHLGGRRILQDVVFIDVDVIPQLPSVATVTEQRLVAFIPFVV